MTTGKGIREAIAEFLPPNNARCIAPPGQIIAASGRPILVPSLMRSGTHILIDLILNNFPAYRRQPLYVDLDHYLLADPAADAVLRGGCYVLKTHAPNFPLSERGQEALRQIAEKSYIISPVRLTADVQRSQAAFGLTDAGDFRLSRQKFDAFWQPYSRLQVPFDELVDPSRCPGLLRRISQYVDQPMPASPRLPPGKDRVFQVLVAKTLTRLLGHRAPVINTTIGFAQPPIPPRTTPSPHQRADTPGRTPECLD